MRRRKTDLPARVNGNLPFEFDDVALTSYAGLELFARYLRRIGFNQLVRHAFAGTPAWGDVGVVAMVRVVIGLIVVGGRRLRHLTYVADDPVFQRFGGVRLVPTARTLSRWLTRFTMPTVRHLVVVKFDGWPLLQRQARCAILGTCKSGQAHQDPCQTPTNQHSRRSSTSSVRQKAPRKTPSLCFWAEGAA